MSSPTYTPQCRITVAEQTRPERVCHLLTLLGSPSKTLSTPDPPLQRTSLFRCVHIVRTLPVVHRKAWSSTFVATVKRFTACPWLLVEDALTSISCPPQDSWTRYHRDTSNCDHGHQRHLFAVLQPPNLRASITTAIKLVFVLSQHLRAQRNRLAFISMLQINLARHPILRHCDSWLPSRAALCAIRRCCAKSPTGRGSWPLDLRAEQSPHYARQR